MKVMRKAFFSAFMDGSVDGLAGSRRPSAGNWLSEALTNLALNPVERSGRPLPHGVMTVDGEEYRAKLLVHAQKRGIGAPTLSGNTWTFEHKGRIAAVDYETTLSEKAGYLIYAKGLVTSISDAPKRPPRLKPPSRELDEGWLYAQAPNARIPENEDGVGKWMMFVAERFIDDTWKNVSAAIKAGQLSDYAKVSTYANSQGGPHVLCVYVLKSDDREEVMAVRERLRVLGFRRRIPYKRNTMTRVGVSGSDLMA
jgi:hypothetical protein